MNSDQPITPAQPVSPAAPPVSTRKKVIRATIGALLSVGVLVGLYYFWRSTYYESTDDATIEGNVVQIAPRVNGPVVELAVADNQLVSAGDLLFQIDPATFQAKVDQAKAAADAAAAAERTAKANLEMILVTSQAEVDRAQAGVAQAQSSLESAKSQLESARAATQQAQADVVAQQAEVERTKTDMARYEELIASHSVSQQQADAARAAWQVAAAKLESNQKKVQACVAQVNQAQAGINAAHEMVNAAKAQLAAANTLKQKQELAAAQYEQAKATTAQLKAAAEAAELDLSYTRVAAPVSGWVTRRSIERGTFVTAGSPVLALVAKDVWVVANFKETQLTHMKVGQKVTIHVDAFPQHDLTGHVDSIQWGTGAKFSLLPPENATGNYVKVVQRVPVKIVFDGEIPPEQLHLAPGMSVVPEVRIK